MDLFEQLLEDNCWKLLHLILRAEPDAYRKSEAVSSLAGGIPHMS